MDENTRQLRLWTASTPSAPRRLSVVICNFNVQRFLGEAIESALAIDWPDVEVIVVDDGSTDDSRHIINTYLPRGITTIFQENAGQALAAEAGFARSTGDLILFLDADDLVEPGIMQAAMKEWRPGISKFQFQMRTIDSNGRSIKNTFPRYPNGITADKIKRWALGCGDYPSPPGSGSLYSREFLTRIFPLERGVDHSAADTYCISAAPFFGDVITIREPLVSYRIHDNNQDAMGSLDAGRFSTSMRRAESRYHYANRIARMNGIPVTEANYTRSMFYLSLRVCSHVLAPDRHLVKNDTRFRILKDAIRALLTQQGNSASVQIALFVWIVAIALLPTALTRTLVSWRFVAGSRPAWLRSAFKSS